MNPKARAELIGVGALVIGLFLGLTLLPWHLTGGLGEHLGSFCRQSLGAGAVAWAKFHSPLRPELGAKVASMAQSPARISLLVCVTQRVLPLIGA